MAVKSNSAKNSVRNTNGGTLRDFKPGQSGNPRGRPPGMVDLQKQFKKLAAQRDEKGRTAIEEIFLRLREDLKSSVRRLPAARLLLGYILGLPHQFIELESEKVGMLINFNAITRDEFERDEAVEVVNPQLPPSEPVQ